MALPANGFLASGFPASGFLASGGGGHHGIKILVLVLVILVIAVVAGWAVYARRRQR